MTDLKGWLTQSNWRKAGAIALAGATGMAMYAAGSGVLRDSVLHAVHFLSEEPADAASPNRSAVFCAIYWSLFVVVLGTALYMAALDIRFIRLRYTLEKRRLLMQGMREAGLHGAVPENGQAGRGRRARARRDGHGDKLV